MKKTTEQLKMELLNRNRNIFKALHELCDYDFESDFDIVKIDGKFTLNSIKKHLCLQDISEKNIVAVLTNIKYRENYNYIVKVTESGFFIDFSRRVYYRNCDHFWGKGQFEDVRKEENKTTYIIIQSNELKRKASAKNPDFSQRFEFVRSMGWSDGRGRHGISQFDIKDKQHNNKQINIRTREASASTNINYYIDKSGYLIEDKKQELKRRAQALRAERKKTAVNSVDFENEIDEINKKIEEAKNELSKLILSACDYNEFCKVDKISTKMRWLFLSVDIFRDAAHNKKFTSIEHANNRLSTIFAEIDSIFKLISED